MLNMREVGELLWTEDKQKVIHYHISTESPEKSLVIPLAPKMTFLLL